MKTIVIHVMDSVCAKNNRDPEARKLIERAALYGKVESGESFMAAEKAKYQVELNNLHAQLEEIKEKKVTPEELDVLRALRRKAASEAAALKGGNKD